jgi:competence protein ComEC
LYVAMIGSPAPAVRSGVMLTVSAASRALQRPTSRWAALAVGAFVPLLLDPRVVLDLGYQLSVGGIAGLIGSSALVRRIFPDDIDGWRRRLASGLVASGVATLVSAPLVAWSFGRVSLIAPLTNLVADPIIGLAQPMLFFALVLSPLPSVARFVADAAHPLLAAFDGVARTGAAVPCAAVAFQPTAVAATLAGVASAATLCACVSRFPARPALVAFGSLCAAVVFG